jgi:FkbM family methyltransferase
MASVGAKVLSFEPQPSNLFYFQSSLERSNLYNSIELFPIGLGNEVGNFTMYAQVGNQGNSVIGKRLHDDEFNSALAKKMIPYNISVNTLDNVFARPELTGKVISVLKIDAQGFETNILKGSKSLLSSGRIRIIKLELSIKFLEGQGTSCQEVVDLLTGFGYSITLNGAKFDSSKCNILTRDRMEDIIARLHK